MIQFSTQQRTRILPPTSVGNLALLLLGHIAIESEQKPILYLTIDD